MTTRAQAKSFANQCLVAGCDVTLLAAIERFSLLHAAESSRASGWHPQEALEASVFMAWKEYLDRLNIPILEGYIQQLRILNLSVSLQSQEMSLSLDRYIAKGFGRIQAESEEIQSRLATGKNATKLGYSPQEMLAEIDWIETEATLRASVDTIRNVMFLCRRLLSSKLALSMSSGAPARMRVSQRSGEEPKRKREVPTNWFGEILGSERLVRYFGIPTDVEEDDEFPKVCTFTSGNEACSRRTEYEAYRLGEVQDVDVWETLRPLKLDRCLSHPPRVITLPIWGVSSRSEVAASLRAMSPPRSRRSRVGPFGQVSPEPYKRMCRFCSRRTELWASLREGRTLSRYLSPSFCRHHRPQQRGGTWLRPDGLDASTYESRVSKIDIFSLEFARLHVHAAYVTAPTRTAVNIYPDLFIRHLTQTIAVTHFELCRVAWHLVQRTLDDRKKEIVMRVRCGESQSVVAKELGTTRQDVNRVLRNIPHYFCFEGLSTEKCLVMRNELVKSAVVRPPVD